MQKSLSIFLKKHLPLILILVFYLSLSFYNFFQQGLVNWDEAYFVVATHTFSDIFKTFFTEPTLLFSSAYYSNLAVNYGNVYTAGRPFYILLAGIIDTIWRSEYSTRLLSILAGCLVLFFFYKILAFYSVKKEVKIASSLTLAISPLFLIYSRLGLSQILSALLLLISLFYLLKFKEYPKRKYLIALALFTSFLLMSHYNTFLLVAILVLYSIALLYQKRVKAKEYLFYFLFVFILPLLWEIVTQIGVRLAGRFNFPTDRIFSYSGEILNQFRIGGSADVPSVLKIGGVSFLGISQPFYYLKLLFFSETFIIAILFIVGLLFVLRRIKRSEYNILFVLGLCIFAVFSLLIHAKYPRNIIAGLPLIYLLTAFGMEKISRLLFKEKRRKRILLLALFFVVVLGLNLNSYFDIFNLKTNFRQAADFLSTTYQGEEIRIFCSSAPIWRVYLEGYRIEPITTFSLEDGLYQAKIKTIVIEDYFTEVEGQGTYFKDHSKELLKSYKTNIFNVEPIVLDFTYREKDFMESLFEKNTPESKINIYEITGNL